MVACLTGAALADSYPAASQRLFGYGEERKQGFDLFPQWILVMRRHEAERALADPCVGGACRLAEWQRAISSLQGRSQREQLIAVNSLANRVRYVLDPDNYGQNDYWATPREFLYRAGDCEDFAILKYYALRQLGFSPDALRIVVLQDTNLRIPHAVLAVHTRDDILILDNQVAEVVSHRAIAHYVPVYSINERNWWMHLP